MEIMKERYSITELSQRLNVTDHTLRYYEKEFGIHIPKDSRGRRYYTPEMANMMFQIREMRNEGLEIKAIKKILETEFGEKNPPPVVTDDSPVSIVPAAVQSTFPETKRFFEEFKEELALNISSEFGSAKEHFSRELTKAKLELGACVENSSRKLEAKLDKHFQEVDRYLGNWRDKNKGGGFFKRFKNKKEN